MYKGIVLSLFWNEINYINILSNNKIDSDNLFLNLILNWDYKLQNK